MLFEHVFDYLLAFRECYRVLDSGGCLLFTVPFDFNSFENVERAIELGSGEIQHLMPLKYYGDPLSNEGILCYRHYGWRVLDDLKEVDFKDAYACIFSSYAMGCLTNQIIFCCEKL